jgi:hypothetical protein
MSSRSVVIRTDSTIREYHIDEKCSFVFVGEEANPLLKTVMRQFPRKLLKNNYKHSIAVSHKPAAVFNVR